MKSKLLVAYTMRQYASLLLSVASFDMGCSSISAFLELLDVIKKTQYLDYRWKQKKRGRKTSLKSTRYTSIV